MGTLKKLLLAFCILSLCACKGGESSPTVSQAPTPPPGPIVPTLDWFEIGLGCQEVLPGFYWARTDYTIFWVRLFTSLNDCQNNPGTANPLLKVPGQCQTVASFQFGAYEFCYSTVSAGLTNPNNSWLTMEEL